MKKRSKKETINNKQISLKNPLNNWAGLCRSFPNKEKKVLFDSKKKKKASTFTPQCTHDNHNLNHHPQF
jgi:hypothetical protein